MPENSATVSRRKAFDIFVKVMSIAVIPVLGWVIKLEVTNAIQDERIQELQADVQKNTNISIAVQQNTTSLVKLETQLDYVSMNIEDIKRLLAKL